VQKAHNFDFPVFFDLCPINGNLPDSLRFIGRLFAWPIDAADSAQISFNSSALLMAKFLIFKFCTSDLYLRSSRHAQVSRSETFKQES
jgi:hypothetical protein